MTEILLDGRPLDAERLGGIDLLEAGSVTVDATVIEVLFSWSDPQLRDHPLEYEPLERWVVPLPEAIE